MEAETRKILTFKVSEWKTFENQKPKFEIKYPAGLTAVLDESIRLTLSHALLCVHGDPCDMTDNPVDLQELTDFKIVIEIVEGGLKQAIIKGENSAAPSFLVDDTVRSLERYALTIRSLKGFELPYGVEGCGGFRYYFPLNKSSTLLVGQELITELGPIIGNYREYRQLPGVIFPDEEERLFKMIISTFRLLE
ncbi:MAG: hypothetical protein A2Z27_03100 [candidate division Zixibacteria bacterium RBG_16_50_21]|nr:MAG: hypothetical protein A2Z27_03100 [candidate division Zixibacteria bacterium RBG_16_50_21]